MMALPTKTSVLTAFLFFTFLSAASAEFHTHPDFEKRSAHIKQISLLPPQIHMFEIGAGGTLEKMEAWSQAAGANIRKAMKEEFTKREYLQLTEFDELTLSGPARLTYDETFLLYDVISNDILTHTFSTPSVHHTRTVVTTPFFSWKARDFSYALGKEVGMFTSSHVDAYLVVRGFDQRSSGGRKALGVGTALVGAALGVAIIPQRGANLFWASLVDAHTGDILWFSRSLTPHDLRNSEEATKLVLEFMTDLSTIGLPANP
ncbi:MAG: hypothetical protein WBK08_13285 [Nitrospira sp.]|nr:MAG: hypothetical protein E8D42_13105 [Nitrospira sp.]